MIIGSRTASTTKNGYTAKDYVQDGLFWMFDGKENAGFGVHDPNATIWVDLKSGKNLTVNDGCIWGNNFFNPNGYGTTGPDLSGYYTIEVCVKHESGVGLFNASGYSWNVILFTEGNLVRFTSRSGRLVTPFSTGVAMTHSASGSGGIYFVNNTAYINGVSSSRTQNANFTTVKGSGRIGGFTASDIGYGKIDQFYGEIYCLRAYSRALSANEIAANAAIDKERFNLPGVT